MEGDGSSSDEEQDEVEDLVVCVLDAEGTPEGPHRSEGGLAGQRGERPRCGKLCE